jgi:hypothetical protein
MQPERSKIHSLARRQRAAKTHLAAAFGHLRGFPLRVTGVEGSGSAWRWMPVPRYDGTPPGLVPGSPQAMPSLETLREAAIAVASLPKTFPRVWKDVVGPVTEWEARSQAALDALVACVESGKPLPALPPPGSGAHAGARQSAWAKACAWATAFEPLHAERISRHGGACEAALAAFAPADGLATALASARFLQWADLLADHTPASLRPLFAVWSDPAAWRTDGKRSAIGRTLFDHFVAIAETPARSRWRAIAILTRVHGRPVPEEREGHFGPLLRTALGCSEDQLTAMERILDRVEVVMGPNAPIGTIVDAWLGYEAPPALWLRACADYLARGSQTALSIGRWALADSDLASEWSYSRDGAIAPGLLLSAFDALRESVTEAKQRGEWRVIGLLGDLCSFLSDPATVARCTDAALRLASKPNDSSAPPTAADCSAEWLRAAWAMSRSDPERFAAIGTRIAAGRRGRETLDSDPSRQAFDLTTIPCAWLGDLVLSEEGRHHAASLVSVVQSIIAAHCAGAAVPQLLSAVDDELRASAAALPDECRSACEKAGIAEQVASLLATEPAARLALAEEYAREFPSRAALEEERSIVEKLVAAAGDAAPEHLLRRCESLRARLQEERVLTPARATRFLTRGGTTAHRLRMQAWQRALDRESQRSLDRMLGMATPDAWMRDPLTVRCLRAIGGLDPQYRRLAGILLADHAAGRYEGWLRHPANDRWIGAAARTGDNPMDVEGWLRGIGPTEVAHPSLGPLTLDIERDPLEILKIGAWFGTCLEPESSNFFSTVVLAADANKHVLVVRSARGAPIARRIVALDRDGRLWAFRLYSHAADPIIEQATEEYLRRLATLCRIAPNGIAPIEPLTASDWYDDQDDRDYLLFESLLKQHEEPSALVQALRDATSDRIAHSSVIGWIASHERRRAARTRRGDSSPAPPLLTSPLLRELIRFASPEAFRSEHLRHLLASAKATKDADLVGLILQRCRRLDIDSVALARAFVDAGDPIEGMRVLRRCRGWRSWGAAELLETLAEAQYALGRPRRACDTLDRAIERCWHDETRTRLETRRETIRQTITPRGA